MARIGAARRADTYVELPNPLYLNRCCSLKNASGAMANGDLTRRVRLTSRGELGTIGDSFDAMAVSFSQALRKVSDSSMQVTTAASQVHSIAERIATGAEVVAAQSATVATAGEEMSATSGDIAQNCQMAAEGAQRASQTAHNGAEVVEKTVRDMSQIATVQNPEYTWRHSDAKQWN